MEWRKYREVAADDEESFDERPNDHSFLSYCKHTLLSPYPWMLCTFALLCVICFLVWHGAAIGRNSYAGGFDTEFDLAKSAIEVTKVRFTGSLRYTAEGELYVDYGNDGPQYFGEPSPEIDDAWKYLIGPHMVVHISDEEAQTFDKTPFKHPVDGTIVGPDALHSLHCVNNIRMLFDSEHYFNRTRSELKKVHRLHFEHCLNHIRQLIQCHLDITPIPSEYFASVNTAVGNFDQIHTCRKISKLRDWVSERWSNTEDQTTKMPSKLASTDKSIPSHGYIFNDDSKLGWDEAHHDG